jgi:hypothetical protein
MQSARGKNKIRAQRAESLSLEDIGDLKKEQSPRSEETWQQEARRDAQFPRQGEVTVVQNAQPQEAPRTREQFQPRERPPLPAVDVPLERTKLETMVDQRLSGKDLIQFKSNMAALESRAKSNNVSEAQIASTYSEISRLLSSTTGFLGEKDRTKLAKQVMQNAAEPTGINNGFHKTCNATTIEDRTYTKYPEAAAKVVADVALNGSYVTWDGSTIAPPARSLRPDDESNGDPPADGQRNFASHVFQVTAINAFWQRQTVDPRGNTVPKGSLQYEQLSTRMRPDTGERLMDHSKQPPAEVLDSKRNAIQQPYMRTYAILDASEQITGRRESMLMENFYKPDDAADSMVFKDEKEMRQQLVSAKAKGEMPIILVVHTGNEPFKSDARGAAGTWHVVCVNDFDASTDKVSVDNEWGKGSDHFGKNGVPLPKLFKATVEPGTKMQQNMIRRSSEPVVID